MYGYIIIIIIIIIKILQQIKNKNCESEFKSERC